MDEVDLDRLAAAYLHRPASAASIERAEEAGLSLERGAWVLDVGGGPGNHSAVWDRQGLNSIVLDPSAGMLSYGTERNLRGVRGRSQAIPFRSGHFALVWLHLSIHYGDWRRAVDESVRVLSEHGRVEIWTLGPDHHERSMLAQWFPSVERIDNARFPSPDAIADHLAGLVPVVSVAHPVERVVRASGSWLRAVEAGFISTLQLLPADERAAGIEAFRHAHPDFDEQIEYELRFTRIVGRSSRRAGPRPAVQ